ncbi:PAS domain S-box protein [Massilia sp. PAMC28688]|uniref:PAS domain S-box protein n=1 Tax=Massilia sp. PAMC28688 TaxID=2861283 RepID=UPI001C6343D9|nr:PAS domain S-box protein [Massilia sp. PAMC28688]QYF94389.1 PAS domain S-box protein [Massilia sp. PAMC28688]
MRASPGPTTTSEIRFREVFEQSPISMQLLALDGTTVGVNKAWEALWLGAHGDALKALVLSGRYNILSDPQLEAKGIAPFLRRAFAGETVNIPPILYDPTELGVEGRPRWVTSRAYPIRDHGGAIVEVMLMHEDISDRVEAERTLRLGEERFRSLVVAISQIVWLCDEDGQLTDDSPSWGQFTGQTVEQWRGNGWLDAVHPEDRAGAAAAWAASQAAATLYQTEYRVRRADGAYRLMEARAVPLQGTHGKVREWVGINTDITEQRRAEQALHHNEQRMRRMFDTMQLKVFTATASGSVDYANQAWTDFTGLPHGGIMGWDWAGLVHPDDLAPSQRAWERSLATGAQLETEQRFRRQDGAYRWHLTRVVPMRGDDGAILMWVGSNTDIHEVKSAETELARRLATERRHFAILSKVAAASHQLHSATTVEDMARQLVEMVRDILEVHQAAISISSGEQPAQAITACSRSDQYAAARPADGAPGLDALMGAAGRTLRLTRAQLVRQLEAAGAPALPGQLPQQGVLAVPLLASDGTRIGLLQASDRREGDFTEEDEAILTQLAAIAASGFENARLYASLQDQHRHKDEFLAMLAHELRNPLAPIRTAADVLAMATPDQARVRQMSGVIGRQVSHMSALVDDLLDVSRVTRGLIELADDELDVRHLVREAIEQAQPMVEARGHTLTVVLCPQPAQVRGDSKRLVQVLANILNNAAKYTPRGGTIEMRTESTADTVTLQVTDNGSGIAPDLQPYVFDLFSQAKRNSDRSQGGLGIGLALVKNLVELHGGSVTCFSSGAGTGSRFTVSLPRLVVQGPRAAGARETASEAVPGQPVRILLVDDNIDAAHTLACYLEAAGHEVMVEHAGAPALTRARVHLPHVCILDIGLPDMDGHALAARLRDLPHMSGVMLIAVTGYGSELDKEKSLAAGFDHHLVKPVDVRLLPALFEQARGTGQGT